jgi:murein DD-endopeptidase MepM/ murein hydrolase activator NlpD
VLPHSSSRFRKLHVSRAFVLSVALVAGLALTAGLYSPHLLFKLQTQSTALEQLGRENEQLRERTADFEEALAEIADQLDGFEDRSGKLANALGVEDLPSLQPATGGPGEAPPTAGLRSILGEELGALQSRADTLDQSLEELDEAFHKRMDRLSSTPNLMPVTGWFSDGFGWRKDPRTGKRQFHRGIDIVADTGTAIVAPADGLVSRATRVADYGKMIDLSHGFGYATRYGHLSEILVRPGQRVRRGEVIGRVGSTGRSTGPHLHYEVFRDGRRVNPWKYLGKRGR